MPIFRLETNLSKDKIPEGFIQELSTVLAETIGRPKSEFVVTIVADQMMGWGGITTEPCATASFLRIGDMGPARNIKNCEAVFEKISQGLGIPKNRMLIELKCVKSLNGDVDTEDVLGDNFS